jgi:hypothetical protein
MSNTTELLQRVTGLFFQTAPIIIACLYLILPAQSHAAGDTVCARVKIEIKQELTLERQAFDAHMRINNGLANISLEQVKIDVSFADQDGNSVIASSDPDNTGALFFIRLDSMENMALPMAWRPARCIMSVLG